jgi:hypothetical protein
VVSEVDEAAAGAAEDGDKEAVWIVVAWLEATRLGAAVVTLLNHEALTGAIPDGHPLFAPPPALSNSRRSKGSMRNDLARTFWRGRLLFRFPKKGRLPMISTSSYGTLCEAPPNCHDR